MASDRSRTPIDDAASQKAIEAGGIPLRARERLEEMREATEAGKEAFFTSTLSVPETAIAKVSGYEPIAQVMGSSWYQIGWAWTQTGEVTAVTRALYDVRQRALSRLWQEAQILGAHAVVGVEIRRRGSDHGGSHLEFTAVGTAVRMKGEPPSREPALTLMNADQLWKCDLAGFWPVGIAMANCVWVDTHCDCAADRGWSNQPLTEHNRVCEQVEKVVNQRFRDHCKQLGGVGVVGVELHRVPHDHHYDEHKHTDFRLELTLMGTAVKRVPKPPEAKVRPLVVFDLSGGKRPVKPTPTSSGHSH
jgi:uncharacterized protein YbjQ (UPF0145 family)